MSALKCLNPVLLLSHAKTHDFIRVGNYWITPDTIGHKEKIMLPRFILMLCLSLPVSVCADDAGKGADIFNSKCAGCHSLSRAKGLLKDVKPDERPAHLRRFLRSHPGRLPDADEQLVIDVLSRP